MITINHFIFEFSDDGAPETKELTMTIGSMTLWNIGNRVRSREFHYPLHLVSANEKDVVFENLWLEHTEEMNIIENNVLHVNGETITVEFQPSADQAWKCWAASVLPASATYPSPYANVHKSQLTEIHGSIGDNGTDTWNPPNNGNKENRFK